MNHGFLFFSHHLICLNVKILRVQAYYEYKSKACFLKSQQGYRASVPLLFLLTIEVIYRHATFPGCCLLFRTGDKYSTAHCFLYRKGARHSLRATNTTSFRSFVIPFPPYIIKLTSWSVIKTKSLVLTWKRFSHQIQSNFQMMNL